MVQTDLFSQITQMQAELSNLVIKVNSLPISIEEVSAELENFVQRLGELTEVSNTPIQGEPSSGVQQSVSPKQPENKTEKTTGLSHYDKHFRSLFASLVGVYYFWDLQTGEIIRSSGLVSLLGTDGQGMGDYPRWLAQVKKEDRKEILPELEEAKLGKRDGYDLEYHVRHVNGKWVLLWDRAVIERDAEGKALRAVGILEDITQLKHNEKVLHLTNQAMAQSNIALREKQE